MDNGADSYRRFLDGDRSAFAEVQNCYFDGLVFFIHRMVHDLYTAEDLAIDTLTELIVYPKRYNFKTSLKTYLFAIARHKALDYLRHRNRYTVTELSEAVGREEQDEIPEEMLLHSERKRIVSDAMDRLPDDQRLAVHLIYFEDLSYEDAAKVMRKNRKQIDNLLYHAKKELKNLIGEEGKSYL
ncbi:MAG: RNA polymerase sigma factor [Eubacteriales bacterium]